MSIEKLTDKLAEIATSLQGPGFEAAKGAASVEAMSTLAGGALGLAFSVGCLYFAGIAKRRADQRDARHGDGTGWHLGCLFALFCTLVFGAPSLWAFIDPWTWAALNHPELWLAKRALGL